MTDPTNPNLSAPSCSCFGDSGLCASTFEDKDGRTCCDLCGKPLPAPSGSDLGEGVVEQIEGILREEVERRGSHWSCSAYRVAATRIALSTPSSTLTPDADLFERAKKAGMTAAQHEIDRCEHHGLKMPTEGELIEIAADEAARVALSATPAIRDRAFEEAAAKAKAAIQNRLRNIDDHYNGAFDNGLNAAQVAADQAIRALKGTPPSNTVEPTSGEDALLGSRDNFHSQQGDRS